MRPREIGDEMSTTRFRRAVIGLLGGAVAILTAGSSAGAAAAAGEGVGIRAGTAVQVDAGQVDAPVPTITWRPCPWYPSARCATASAPLDYDNPTGPTILLDLVKMPATDQAHRLGTIFVNPGGPGGSASHFAPTAAYYLGSSVSARYDVIGIDPRGVGDHAQMVCHTTVPQPLSPGYFPVSLREAEINWRSAQWERAACTDDPGRIVAHMSTADTARDMDLIRQAVGDRRLNYYGVSYGTYLGTTYASMFPTKVGHVIVDAVLDPVAWATGTGRPPLMPFSTRLKSARGAYEALTSGLAECDKAGKARCAFAGHARAKFEKLVDLARAGTLKSGPNEPLPYATLIGGTLGGLYGHDYTLLMDNFQELWDYNMRVPGASADRATAAAGGLAAAAATISTAPYITPLARQTISDAFSGVACSDSRNPRSLDAWWNAGRMQDKEYPWFGSLWTWASSTCGGWPGTTMADAFLGPFGGKTAKPVLVIGNRYDPATPIQGAERVARLFTNSRLLRTLEWGHGALENACVRKAFADYYVRDTVPAPGSVCRANAPLYPGS